MSSEMQQKTDAAAMIEDPKHLEYLMTLRLMPLPGDDASDYHGDKKYIQNCNSVSELKRTIRFLTESKPDLIASATKRLQDLEKQQRPTSTLRVTLKSSSSEPTTPRVSNAASNREKERFFAFVNVLLNYIKHKNHQMYVQAKSIVKDCVSKNKRRERGYENVTVAMRGRLKDLVGDHYWGRANDHFIEHMKRQNMQRKQQPASATGRKHRPTRNIDGVLCA